MSVDLVVAPCSHEAAKYAVMHWHYSQAMPKSKLVKFGVWENKQFIGAVLFSWGANNNIGKPYGLKMTQVCELVRVALTAHKAPVSQIVSKAMKALRKQSPGLRLVVSYADPEEGHNGGIYQAMNWVYQGNIGERGYIEVDGKRFHQKSAWDKFGTNQVEKIKGKWVKVPGKHKYLYPLDKAMRRQIEPLAQPYPKRADVGEMESRVITTD